MAAAHNHIKSPGKQLVRPWTSLQGPLGSLGCHCPASGQLEFGTWFCIHSSPCLGLLGSAGGTQPLAGRPGLLFACSGVSGSEKSPGTCPTCCPSSRHLSLPPGSNSPCPQPRMTSATLNSPVDLSLLLFPQQRGQCPTLWADSHQNPYLSAIGYDSSI